MLFDRNGNPDPTVTPRERARFAKARLNDLSFHVLYDDDTDHLRPALAEAASALLYWEAVADGRSRDYVASLRAVWRDASEWRRASEREAGVIA